MNVSEIIQLAERLDGTKADIASILQAEFMPALVFVVEHRLLGYVGMSQCSGCGTWAYLPAIPSACPTCHPDYWEGRDRNVLKSRAFMPPVNLKPSGAASGVVAKEMASVLSVVELRRPLVEIATGRVGAVPLATAVAFCREQGIEVES